MLIALHGENPTRIGLIYIYSTAIIGTLLLILMANQYDLQLTQWQWVIYCLVSADVLAGAVANMTPSTNAYYRSKPMRVSIIFLMCHIIHPALLALVGMLQWLDVVLVFGYMLIAGIFILQQADNQHQRVLASACWVIGVVIADISLQFPIILLWFVPIYFFKLLIAFAVTQPSSDSANDDTLSQ